jgi:small subunit ribosomal protein S28e
MARNNEQKQDNNKNNSSADAGLFTKAFSAKVEEIIGRSGTRGDVIQVRCKILEGRDSNKIIRRNVRGPTKVGDILMLRETEFEAQKLNSGRK